MSAFTQEEILAAYRYAERLAREFEMSLDPRCYLHQHDGNPCKRCRFIRIEERRP